MFELIREYQLNIMLALCAISAMSAVLLLLTRFLPKRRKWILVLIEVIVTLTLLFDRTAYIYRGDLSRMGYIMVRLSNFMVFFLTPACLLGFNLYVMDLLASEGKMERMSKRLIGVHFGAIIGMVMVVISQFSGLYYYFDDQNRYQRGPGFWVCYILPVVLLIVQFTVIWQYRKAIRWLIFISLVLFIFVPITLSIIQIFAYGISLNNMSMVVVSVFLYIFAYLDINDEVVRAHEIEVENLEKEHKSMKRLFDQTTTAIVAAVEKKDRFSQGRSKRVADLAKRIAYAAGHNEEDCDKVYYAALLHDIGMIGIPDSVIEKADELDAGELELIRQKPLLSGEILSSITEYPYLSQSALHSCERYDGTGYPEGLDGQKIPEISRIIAVADAYDAMTSRKRYREPLSHQVVREEFIKQSGLQFDPTFSKIMVHMMDTELAEKEDIAQVETELRCGMYRAAVSTGIPVTEEITKIHFECEESDDGVNGFSAPSILIFDAYDRHVHDNPKAIEAYRYLEYGEVWFDGHYVSTGARNMSVQVTDTKAVTGRKELLKKKTAEYEIIAGRFEDHLSIRMTGPMHMVDVILALPDNSKASYIGLTGENCHIKNIAVQKTGDKVAAGDIQKIVSPISYIDRMESDVPNIQIDRFHSAATEGIPVGDGIQIDFHTMSLPSANLVWHCPHIVLFYADDKKVGGKGYREYALIKINGEVSGDSNYAENRFSMKKSGTFPGWDVWKDKNKEGMECSVRLARKGNKIVISTENLGITIENTMVVRNEAGEVYAALTGDQVALTDIRIR